MLSSLSAVEEVLRFVFCVAHPSDGVDTDVAANWRIFIATFAAGKSVSDSTGLPADLNAFVDSLGADAAVRKAIEELLNGT